VTQDSSSRINTHQEEAKATDSTWTVIFWLRTCHIIINCNWTGLPTLAIMCKTRYSYSNTVTNTDQFLTGMWVYILWNRLTVHARVGFVPFKEVFRGLNRCLNCRHHTVWN